MGISERTKRLLAWWQLRIEKSREETKENVERNDIDDASDTSLRTSTKGDKRQ